ncbi:NARE ribosyltransferase, partial [Gymnorhina tibicen]|nr:NARE ribosyltransferase [Gymnorhina tibicen]
CGPAMTDALPALNRSEFQQNSLFAEVWVKATDEWQKRGSPVSPLSSPAQAIALMAYTMHELYEEFNAAVHEAGSSRQEYRDNFHFKALHFLLTQALATLRVSQGQPCYCVFHGMRNVQFEVKPGATFRFGQFMATSLCKIANVSEMDTVLTMEMCCGADIRNFSYYPGEKEVLIPPFETFSVTYVIPEGKVSRIHLNSTGTHSNYNCEWLQGDIMGTTWGTG